VIVGAGVAGLACATALRARGVSTLVLERARGVGGRCATRRVAGQPVDHGVCFLHGTDPSFLAALAGVEGASPVPGWPRRVEGRGVPCQPRAFAPDESRLAFVEGVSSFAKHLARGLEVRLGSPVRGLEPSEDAIEVRCGDSESVRGRVVVLALAVEQARALLASIPDPPPPVRSVLGLLKMIGSLSCWTVLAGYPPEVPRPIWEMLYPESSRSIQLVSHDSSKRAARAQLVLVYQSLPRWARTRLEDPAEQTARALLAEGARVVGEWAGRPAWAQAHRWRYARTDRGTELSQPLLLPVGKGARLGIAGEAFHPGGGVEGAWLAGVHLAQLIAGDGPA